MVWWCVLSFGLRPKPSVATLDTPRSCIASKVTTLTRIPGSGGPIPVTVGTFATKVRHQDFFWGDTIGGRGGGTYALGSRATNPPPPPNGIPPRPPHDHGPHPRHPPSSCCCADLPLLQIGAKRNQCSSSFPHQT